MSIIRLIHIKIDPSETETAERIWKTECATLMISQKGCISEKLLRARDRGEFISYSEWEKRQDPARCNLRTSAACPECCNLGLYLHRSNQEIASRGIGSIAHFAQQQFRAVYVS